MVLKDGIPAVGGLLQAALFKVQIAQPIGCLVPDTGRKVGPIDFGQPLLLLGAVRLAQQLFGPRVVKQPVRLASGRRQGGQQLANPRTDRQHDPAGTFQHPARFGIDDLLQRLKGPIPQLSFDEAVVVGQMVRHFRRLRRQGERTMRRLLGKFILSGIDWHQLRLSTRRQAAERQQRKRENCSV